MSSVSTMPSIENLSSLTVAKLKKMCTDEGITDIKGLRKAGLVSHMQNVLLTRAIEAGIKKLDDL
jgi:hypothetical protein